MAIACCSHCAPLLLVGGTAQDHTQTCTRVCVSSHLGVSERPPKRILKRGRCSEQRRRREINATERPPCRQNHLQVRKQNIIRDNHCWVVRKSSQNTSPKTQLGRCAAVKVRQIPSIKLSSAAAACARAAVCTDVLYTSKMTKVLKHTYSRLQNTCS